MAMDEGLARLILSCVPGGVPATPQDQEYLKTGLCIVRRETLRDWYASLARVEERATVMWLLVWAREPTKYETIEALCGVDADGVANVRYAALASSLSAKERELDEEKAWKEKWMARALEAEAERDGAREDVLHLKAEGYDMLKQHDVLWERYEEMVKQTRE